MTEYEELELREPDAEDLRRLPDALRVLANDDMAWPMTRANVEALRDQCNEALGEIKP